MRRSYAAEGDFLAKRAYRIVVKCGIHSGIYDPGAYTVGRNSAWSELLCDCLCKAEYAASHDAPVCPQIEETVIIEP